jgi:hypothetical protein
MAISAPPSARSSSPTPSEFGKRTLLALTSRGYIGGKLTLIELLERLP